jgi:hypothetical protein
MKITYDYFRSSEVELSKEEHKDSLNTSIKKDTLN